ncbi:MAG TPA: hypothetical protein VF718_07005 [Allosphingosinicella sp.]|jgi:hypothetical protein
MRLALWPLLIVATCAPAADGPSIADDLGGVEVPRPSLRPAYAGPIYFPPSLGEPTFRCKFGDPARLQPILSDFERDWYSRQLAAAEEPSLYLASQSARPLDGSTLRFTWLRSFHPPVVIRLEMGAAPAGPHRLVAKQLSGAGGYHPGKVAKTIDRPLTPEEAERLRVALDRNRVFGIPPDPCGGGCDGAQWIFEGVEGRRYRFLSVWTPHTGPALGLGQFLMGLTGWDFGTVY